MHRALVSAGSLATWAFQREPYSPASAVLPTHGRGCLGTLQRFATCEVAVLAQLVVVGEALVHHRVALGFRHVLKLVRFDVSKANVFHNSSPICCSDGLHIDRFRR